MGEVTKKAFNFPTKHNLPLFFASAADGTNVVAMFEEAITLGHQYKTSDKGADDFLGDVMDLLEEGDLGGEKDELRLTHERHNYSWLIDSLSAARHMCGGATNTKRA